MRSWRYYDLSAAILTLFSSGQSRTIENMSSIRLSGRKGTEKKLGDSNLKVGIGGIIPLRITVSVSLSIHSGF